MERTIYLSTMFSIVFLCYLVMPLYASIEDHIPRIENKGHAENHSMAEIDYIYLINLDKRPEKYLSTVDQLQPYGIHPFRVSAVNGWELPLEVVNDLGVKWKPGMPADLLATTYPLEDAYNSLTELMHDSGQTYFTIRMRLGAIGCYLSHLAVLQDALKNDYNTIWILEDDIEVIRSPYLIPDYIRELDDLVGPGNWDILFTDKDAKSNDTGEYVPCFSYSPKPNFTPSNPNRFSIREEFGSLAKVGARYSTHSMIMRRSGIEKILNFAKQYKIFLPIDMDIPQIDDINLWVVTEDIVSNKPGSATDNAAPHY